MMRALAGVPARRDVLQALGAGVVLAIAAGGAPALLAATALDPATGAVRRLMALAARAALARLAARDGFWDSPVARVELPRLFNPNGRWPGPLATPTFRDDLAHRLNTIAGNSIGGLTRLSRRAAARVAVPDPPAVLNGGPTAATSLLRAEIGPGLVNALTPAIVQSLRRADDPVIRQATTALNDVSVDAVARALANAVESAIWYAVGAEEAAIRRDPAGNGAGDLAAALPAS